MRCYRRLLNNTYKDQFTKEEDSRKIQAAIAEYDELLPLEEAEHIWFGHVSRSSGLATNGPTRHIKEKRRRDRQKKMFDGNINDWTGMD